MGNLHVFKWEINEDDLIIKDVHIWAVCTVKCVCVYENWGTPKNSMVYHTEIAIRYTLFQTPLKIILLVMYLIISPY